MGHSLASNGTPAGIPRNPGFHGYPWISQGFHGIPYHSDIHDFPEISGNANPWISLPGPLVIHDHRTNYMASAGAESFNFLTYQLATVGVMSVAHKYI